MLSVNAILMRRGFDPIISPVFGNISCPPLVLTDLIERIRLLEKGKMVEKLFEEVGNYKLLMQFRTVAENGLISLPSLIYRVGVK